MWKVLAVIAALTLSALPARAAEITFSSHSTDKINMIAIFGEIVPGDEDKFRQIVVDRQKQTAVLLSSPGGNVRAALAIGEMIHEGDYATVVPDDAVCASACGLVWLGGGIRYVSETARIGFHAAYVGDAATKRESGVANAMVGAYLARIGLSDEAVGFLTSAPPDDMQWLHPADARSIGIDFTTVPAEPSSEAWSAPSQPKPSLAAAAAPATRPAITPAASSAEERASKLILSWYAMWSNMGTDTSILQRYYGDTVQYYGGTTPKAKVMLEKQKFAARWPIRAFTVSSMTVSCLAECVVAGVVDWDVSSLERGERSTGSANFVLEISATGPLIVLSENGSVLARHKEPLAPPDDSTGSTAEPQANSISPAFADGRRARIDYEQWVAGLTDPVYKDGVLFWAANRSTNSPPSCRTVAPSDLWSAGCLAAQSRLTPSDTRRKSENEFRSGWNSL